LKKRSIERERKDKMKKEKKQKKTQTNSKTNIIFVIILLTGILFTIGLVLAAPGAPTMTSVSNSTGTNINNGFINISGGYIATVNLTANFQNTRWKAFIGNVTGKFTLNDAGGFTIFDWTLATTTGRVYATRTSGAVTWSSINCSTVAAMENENTILAHNSTSDNITRTFNGVTHSFFYAAGKPIQANWCHTLNTYKNNATQDVDFEEMAMSDGTNMIYATILEDNVAGYNGAPYDFQMLVPENGSALWTGAIAYYLYVELD
jgi:hypothetical protein